MLLIVKIDKAFDPFGVTVLRTDAVVLATDDIAHLVEQSGISINLVTVTGNRRVVGCSRIIEHSKPSIVVVSLVSLIISLT